MLGEQFVEETAGYTGDSRRITLVDNPALVSLTFDDGLRCQFEQGIPILDRYGFLGTFFLIANEQPKHEDRCAKIKWNAVDISTLKELVHRGHEIGSHTVQHCPPTMQNLEAHISRRLIKEWLGGRGDSILCLPLLRHR
jgi:peptidoglycan/xylan/chitin deacetylase (PgdA/CDA1 family)